MMRLLAALLLLLLLLLLLAGCAAKPLPKEPLVNNGASMKTLQGAVNISLTSPSGQLGGNGFLFYQRPDSFRLTILAPFGQSIFDIIITGDRVLCLMESRKKGWQGSVQELPEWLGARIWPLLQWMVEAPPPAGPSLQRSFTRPDGTLEKIYYDAAGLVQKKVNAGGDAVDYSEYRSVDGIAVAGVIKIRTVEGSSLQLTFDEPEVNRVIDPEVLSPQLDRYQILPLSEFEGFGLWK